MKTHTFFYILLFCSWQLLAGASSHIVINQIMYDTPGNEVITAPPYSNGEFIELLNIGDTPTHMQGWMLKGGGKTEVYAFPDITLPAKGYLVVAYRHSRTPDFSLSDFIPHADVDDKHLICYQNKIVLANSGEAITLWNAQGQMVDSIYYDGSSNKRKPDRLSADNMDSIAHTDCRSIVRTHATLCPNGGCVTKNADWYTDNVRLFTYLPTFTMGVGDDFYTDSTVAMPQDMTYMLRVTPLDATSSVSCNEGNVRLDNYARAAVGITYYDGFGRVEQQQSAAATPQGGDLVAMTEYQGMDKAYRQWMAVPCADNKGQFVALDNLRNSAETFYDDTFPFAEALYEKSVLSRVIEYKRAGEAWQTHPIKANYGYNAVDEVKFFEARNNILMCQGYYEAGTLYKLSTTDEDGKTAIQYTDKLGRTIMQSMGNGMAKTYYVYNGMGQLAFVLPPAIADNIFDGMYSEDSDLLKKFAYVYRYDSRGHMIYKRLPGCESIYMIYDKGGRLVETQDGNQRARGNYWTVCKYDSLSRLIYTAEVQLRKTNLQDEVEAFQDWCVFEIFSTKSMKYPMENTGYSREFYHIHPTRLLTVNYYDTYEFLTLLPDTVQEQFAFIAANGQKEPGISQGLLTGTRTYLLDGTGQYTSTVFYYDVYGRQIQAAATNHLGGYDHTSIRYDFAGNILRTDSRHTTANGNEIQEVYTHAYDHANRLQKTYYQLNDEPAILLTDNRYDELGRLVERYRHNGIDKETYAYNIQNQLTKIQSGDFQEELMYTSPLPTSSMTACYNGNMAGNKISQDNITCTFNYYYDPLNRLISSTMHKNPYVFGIESYSFDKMGNITRLKRYNNGDEIDDLEYIYNGNQLETIIDNAGSSNRYALKEYNSRTNGDSIWQYDPNGNLCYDMDRSISAMHYNLLNLPDTIQFHQGSQIINTYAATGKKLRSRQMMVLQPELVPIGKIASNISREFRAELLTDYHRNIEYVYIRKETAPYQLLFVKVYHPEGYTQYDYVDNQIRSKQTYYFRRDHLGNNVAVWNADNDTTVQRTYYYPSGLPMAMSTSSIYQNHKYNGKEYLEMNGYDMYDYGFRQYYATIGRFTSIDPLCELSPSQSTYAHASNNPINNIDYMGLLSKGSGWKRDWVAIDEDGNVAGFDLESPDHHVYQVDDNWDGTYDGLSNYEQIGWQIPGWKDYTIGQPCYYLGAVSNVSYSVDGYTVRGSQALMYGKKPVTKTIDSNIGAVIHYYEGNGESIMLGNVFTKYALLIHPKFWMKYIENIGKPINYEGSFTINMTYTMFHIGRTTVSYYKGNNYSIYSLGTNDGFWDPNFIAERYCNGNRCRRICNRRGATIADKKGPNLELGGEPYDYIPFVFMWITNK